MAVRFSENRLSRRRFLQSIAATGLVALGGGIAFPRISRAADRPLVTHGVQSGDVGIDQAVLWSRTDRPAQAIFEWATTESFKDARVLPAITALPDMPLSIIVWDNFVDRKSFEAVSNNDAGKPLGRELEFADLLRFIKAAGVRNTVWLTADVHYTAAHYYDPNKAAFQDFDPFWEFVSGPIHAGTFGPNELDMTFGPELKFVKAPPAGQSNLPPSAGLQFFGHVRIAADTRVMTVALRDTADAVLWSIDLEPRFG